MTQATHSLATDTPLAPPRRFADLGDYLKVCACTAVILQPIIGQLLTSHPSHPTQALLGGLYVLSKFSAPAFIFGILYTTTRTHPGAGRAEYPAYLRSSWHALFVPTIWWTPLFLPGLQQGRPYHNLVSFVATFVNGQAAPHLWYNTMMLQFILLMPLFWALARWVTGRPRRGLAVALVALCFHLLWLAAYWLLVKHGWWWLDRLAISFALYGSWGTLAASFRQRVRPALLAYWKLALVLLTSGWLAGAAGLRVAGFPVTLAKAPYYTPAMTAYALGVIATVAAVGVYQQVHQQTAAQRAIHALATYAYRAYLSNLCWLQVSWGLTRPLHQAHPGLTLAICWLLTWALSFGSAVGIHWAWTWVKKKF